MARLEISAWAYGALIRKEAITAAEIYLSHRLLAFQQNRSRENIMTFTLFVPANNNQMKFTCSCQVNFFWQRRKHVRAVSSALGAFLVTNWSGHYATSATHFFINYFFDIIFLVVLFTPDKYKTF